jgi:hypothetical protein
VQLSNGNVYQKTHDELDFEFLGNVRGREWRVQTNVYGNGSTDAGREERYDLPFDPTDEFHHYSILWTQERIVYVTFLHLASCNSLSDTISMSRPSWALRDLILGRCLCGAPGSWSWGSHLPCHNSACADEGPLFAAAGVG